VGGGLLPNEDDHDTARPPTFILMFIILLIPYKAKNFKFL